MDTPARYEKLDGRVSGLVLVKAMGDTLYIDWQASKYTSLDLGLTVNGGFYRSGAAHLAVNADGTFTLQQDRLRGEYTPSARRKIESALVLMATKLPQDFLDLGMRWILEENLDRTRQEEVKAEEAWKKANEAWQMAETELSQWLTRNK